MEDLVTYKTAKLAKSVGYDITHRYGQDTSLYDADGEHTMYANYGLMGSGLSYGYISAPTQSQLHSWIIENRGVLISIYNNASGYLWALSKVPGGTDLGWCDHNGPNNGGSWDSFEDAFENALGLVLSKSLDEFSEDEKDKFHWGNYARYIKGNLKK